MPADFSTPTTTTGYTTVLTALKERDVDALTLLGNGDPSNTPAGAMKWNRAGSKLQEYVSSAWEDKVLSIAGGGTGSSTQAGARSSLGLGSMAVQNDTAVTIAGGTITAPTNIWASAITSGIIASARLGTGGAGAGNKVLADNGTFKDFNSVPVASGFLWFTNSAPTGYLICDGSAVSRTTYAALFAVIGTTYGVGDGSTTFNLPDLRQRIPIGKAASGTGNTLAGTFGSIDHVHSGPLHSHSYSQVPNHTHPVSITDPGHSHVLETFNAGGGSTTSLADITVNGTASATGTSGLIRSATTGITAVTSTPTGGVVSGTTQDNGNQDTGTANPPCLVINFIIKT